MNAPMSFQAVMSKALKGINWKYCLAFMDDIIVFSENWNEHKKHLNEVFARLRKANLKLHPAKCNLACSEVPYLGYKIGDRGLSVNNDKVKAVLEYPVPTNVSEVRSFLGLAQYYSRFIPNYSSIASVLHALTKTNDVKEFTWNVECQNAFEQLRNSLVSPPILALPKADSKPVIYTDACDKAVGFILGQIDSDGKETVIEYGGRALHDAEKNYSICHKEGLALVIAIEKYKHYIADKHFLVLTDHISLKWLKSIKDANGRLGRWSLLLQPYDFEIKHKSGKKHGNADGLSRRPYKKECNNEKTVTDLIEHLPVLATGNLNNDSASEKIVYELDFDGGFLGHEVTKTINAVSFESKIDLPKEQRDDKLVNQYIEFLSHGLLPDDSKLARVVEIRSQDMILQDNLLYHLYTPGNRRIGPI